jgi:hypothetical protein
LPIPGKPYTFGVVVDAQALGDFQILRESQRRVVRINLAKQDDFYIKQWVNKIL